VIMDDKLYLVFIVECIQRIELYTRDGKDKFLADMMTQDAVMRNLHVLSESTQRLSDIVKSQHPEVAWRIISGFRNVVVHDYLGIDVERVWDTVEHDLPALKRSITTILGEIKP
jgi:uncharacterized protein with HEPN domain